MKTLRLTSVLFLSLICTINSSYAQPPVVDDSDEYTLSINMHEASEVNPIAKSAEPEEEEVWKNDAPLQDQPLVNDSKTEETDIDADSLAEQLHNLQTEIQDLRGQIEVQAHDLKMLQQQQLAFYKDLDSRIQKQKQDPSDGVTSTNAVPSTMQTTGIQNKKDGNPADEQISYLAAYELIKTKQFDEALKAMHQFIKRYPNSGYNANAHYWVGELYLVKNENELALQAFNTVLTQYPKSSKAAASELKAGYALANLGQIDAARSKLRHVITQFPDTKTAQLAQKKLDSMN